MATIAIEVPPNVAQRYAQATPQERERLDALIAAQLQSALASAPERLGTIMDGIAEQARSNGLTAAALKRFLSA